MKKILLIALLLLSSQVQAADPPPWLYPVLKVDNPNELAVYVYASPECPVTTDELKEVLSGVLIGSRVKPLLGEEYLKNSLYLSASIGCLEPDKPSGYQVFSIPLAFGSYNVRPPVTYLYPYGFTGTGPKDDIISSFKNQVEEAVTDYIAANFDL
jgi:hypothetical protein